MTTRTPKTGHTLLKTFDEEAVGVDPVAWLVSEAKDGMLLLAHAEDGVIWGQVQDGLIATPSTNLHQQAVLRPVSLLAARLFDKDSEIYLWRTDENQWRARRLTDSQGETCEYLDETQVLWGTEVEDSEVINPVHAIGFSRVAEGVQGLRHAVPLLLPKGKWSENRLRLGVRHYLQNDDGWRRINMSRLTGLWHEEVPK